MGKGNAKRGRRRGQSVPLAAHRLLSVGSVIEGGRVIEGARSSTSLVEFRCPVHGRLTETTPKALVKCPTCGRWFGPSDPLPAA